MSEVLPLSQSEFPTQSPYSQQQRQGQSTVACMICHAIYTPSTNQPQLAHAPQSVLESALLGMCHFCFRCRRPSCPFCWDAVHGICGSCVLETGLPFRSEVPPLSGTWLPPMRQGQPATNNGAAYPLVGIQPGRLAGMTMQTIQTVQPGLANPIGPSMNMMPPQVSPVAGAFPGVAATFPQNIQNVQNAQPMPPMPPMMQPPPIPTTPDATQSTRNAHTSKRARSAKALEEDHLAPYYIYIDDGEDVVVDGSERQKQVDTEVSPSVHPMRKIERAVTLLLLVVIALLMITIIAASFSSQVNGYIAQALHIDIRAEITYLWQLLSK